MAAASSPASGMTHISRGCANRNFETLQSRGARAITRRGRSVPAGWLGQPACRQRLHKMSLAGERSVWMPLRTRARHHFWKGTGCASGCGRAYAREREQVAQQPGARAVVAPTKANHARRAHLSGLVSSSVVQVCLRPPDGAKSEEEIEFKEIQVQGSSLFFSFVELRGTLGPPCLTKKKTKKRGLYCRQ